MALARLDEALLLLRAAVAERARPEPASVEPVRRAVDRYLIAAGVTSTGQFRSAPQAPDTDPLRAAGIPLEAPARYAERAARESDRRRRLQEIVASDGCNWPTR